ncbi:hypothetical protein ONZ45_g16306 [Pleurotus djamor]|nr:hypothetical protein ONZ45_g16306 [Pleurotus djamor]
MIAPTLLKAAIVLSTALAFHWTSTPPKPPVEEKERQRKGIFERTARYQVFFLRIFVWGTAAMEVNSSFNKSPSRYTFQSTSDISLILVIGGMMAVAGSLLRLWCFKTLGKMFDFQIRIHADHQLVTSGPYAYVRHPSYTGWFSMVLGVTMVLFAPGSWLRGSGLPYFAESVAWIYWCTQTIGIVAMLALRMRAEDEGLKQNFGEEWERTIVEFNQCTSSYQVQRGEECGGLMGRGVVSPVMEEPARKVADNEGTATAPHPFQNHPVADKTSGHRVVQCAPFNLYINVIILLNAMAECLIGTFA